MKAPTVTQRVIAILTATMLLALSGSMAFATALDYRQRGIVPTGVSVNGTDLSGMTEAQARDAIAEAVTAPLMRAVPVAVDGRTFLFDPRGAVTVDADAMIAEAYAPRRTAAFIARVRHAITGEALSVRVAPAYSVDSQMLAQWLQGTARTVNRRAVDATLTIEDSRVKITPEVPGVRVDLPGSARALRAAFDSDAALGDAERLVTLPTHSLPASVTTTAFKQTIVVDISQRKVRLFAGARLVKTYPCAVGTPSFPTPKGHFEVVQKRYMPTWVNPGSGWAKDMPPSIPPGPGNPLGTRAINLSASGIRFHGTTKTWSVGTAASHGCMRMLRHDIEDLYDRVKVGTQVYIVP